MEQTDKIEVTQADREAAEEAVSGANIVSHDGYYEIDIDAVSIAFARHRLAHSTPPASPDFNAGLEAACAYLESMATRRSDHMKIAAIRALRTEPPAQEGRVMALYCGYCREYYDPRDPKKVIGCDYSGAVEARAAHLHKQIENATNNPTQVEPVEGLVERLLSSAYERGYHDGREDAPSIYHDDTMREGFAQWQADNLAALKSATPASAEVEAICELLTKRDGQEFDGEVHLNSEEASYIRRLLRSLSTRLAAVEAERDEAVGLLRAWQVWSCGQQGASPFLDTKDFLARKDAEQ